MARSIIAIAALAGFALCCSIAPGAAQGLGEQLPLGHLGTIDSGSYSAGDNVRFSLAGSGDNFLLRFDGDPEVFVLYTVRTSLGGRALKYDSGETALQVAGWGGMTLYTDAQPNGLPTVRTGDAIVPAPPNVSLGEIQNAAGDEGEHLAYTRGLRLNFTADWGALAGNAAMRAFAFDTLENAVRGLDRFSVSSAGREALTRRIGTVMIATSAKPTITLAGKTLIVTFNPERGYAGRASSRAIARALHSVFPKK